MACVGLSQRFSAIGQRVSDEYRCPRAGIERVKVEAQLYGQRIVLKQQPWCAHDRRFLRNVESLEFASERIIEAERSGFSDGLEYSGHRQVCHTALSCCGLPADKRTSREVTAWHR